MNAPFRTLAALAVLLALSACDTVTTDNPIGVTDATETDPQLTGAWKIVDMPKTAKDDGTAYAFFLPRKDGGFNAVALGFGTDKSDAGYYGLEILSGKVGDIRFMNAVPRVDDGKPEDDGNGYWPVLYRFDAQNQLHVYNVSADGIKFLADAIDDHRLAGTVTKHPVGSKDEGSAIQTTEIHITADQKSLDAFFGANAGQIFTEPLYTLRRVTMP